MVILCSKFFAQESGGAPVDKGSQVGVDVGSSLTKLAVRDFRGRTTFKLLAKGALDEVAQTVTQARPLALGLTGGGAPRLAKMLDFSSVQVCEFTAWGAGANHLLPESHENEAFLLVSLGTGTSVMLVEGTNVRRMGGTALGGGTILGLGAALCGSPDFATTCKLAGQGSRNSVDLLVRDIYPELDSPLKGDLTASAFGRLGRGRSEGVDQADMAASVMRLVGENVALISGGLAHRAGVQRIVYGGSTLRDNPVLANVLSEITAMLGLKAAILKDGEFAGAVGAMETAPLGVGKRPNAVDG